MAIATVPTTTMTGFTDRDRIPVQKKHSRKIGVRLYRMGSS
jgi:hypothetical protein